ncbi:glycine betaine ABC transporter substrate-binding protein, partial [Acinetobacter baumannii]
MVACESLPIGRPTLRHVIFSCELENSEMLKSYGLEETFTNFRPGTGPALDAAVLSSYRRGEPILFYYWSPTPLMGRA